MRQSNQSTMTNEPTDDDQNRNATDDEEELESTHIVQTGKGWGSGSRSDEALQNMLKYNDDFEGDVEVYHHHVRGDWEMTMFSIRAEEMVDTTVYEMSGDKLNMIADLLGKLDLETDTLFADSPVIEDEDEDEEADDE